ncbi:MULTISPECIES: hypothetical protein [unclassified Micromonospora]|uniref:hypothetical protein n=1 Tax=unclassified Micromonospora TaxID=2617518 RepID=UPI003A885F5D
MYPQPRAIRCRQNPDDLRDLAADDERVDPQRARQHLADTAAIWSVGATGATDVIDAACACLLAGLDTPTLRILAGITPTRGNESDELRRWLEGALTELSLTYYREGSRAGEEEALRVMARRLLAGTIGPRDLTSWAYGFITHEGTPLAAELINLGNSYEYVDAIYEGHRQPRAEVEEIDAAVTAEARRLISDAPAESG